MKRVGVALLLAGLLLCLSARAQCSDGVPSSEIDGEIARQLMAPGWEYLGERTATPAVVFTVDFVELDSNMSDHVRFGFEADTGASDNSWSVSFDQVMINLLRSVAGRLNPRIEGMQESETVAASYQSWLVTLEGSPVEININETEFSGSVTENLSNSLFRLSLTPERIDTAGELVLTTIGFELLTQSGAIGKIISAVEIGKAAQPVAVVRRRVALSDEVRDQYLAMHLSADVVPQHRLPQNAAMLPIGSLAGFEQLLGLDPRVDPRTVDLPARQWKLSLSGPDLWRLGLGWALPLSADNLLYGHAEFSQAGLGGEAGLIHSIYDGLGFVVHLDASTDRSRPMGSSMLRLGFTDSTVLGEKLHLRATLLPIQIDLTDVRASTAGHVMLEAVWRQRSWDVWYHGYWHDAGFDNEVGITVATASQMRFDFSCRRDPNGSTQFTIGLIFQTR